MFKKACNPRVLLSNPRILLGSTFGFVLIGLLLATYWLMQPWSITHEILKQHPLEPSLKVDSPNLIAQPTGGTYTIDLSLCCLWQLRLLEQLPSLFTYTVGEKF
jgi:hypothetical protein